MTGEERDQQLYRYPGSTVLRNRLDIRDAEGLEFAERMLVRQRMEEGCPNGDFDLTHLQAIHRHLFQDVYEWAGEIRLVPMAKGESQFFPPNRIGLAMQDIHSRILKLDYLRDLRPDQFAQEAANIIGDVNVVHPFREGNGRAQVLYLQQLGERAGHKIDLTRLERERWIEASIRASQAVPNYDPMRDCIHEAMPSLTRNRGLKF